MMANQLKMAEINAILTLHKSGHSKSEIGRMLGIHRGTVARYISQQDGSKSTEPDHRVRPGPSSRVGRIAIRRLLKREMPWRVTIVAPHTVEHISQPIPPARVPAYRYARSSANSIALSSPRALLSVSFHSFSGTLSATMPAPAWT